MNPRPRLPNRTDPEQPHPRPPPQLPHPRPPTQLPHPRPPTQLPHPRPPTQLPHPRPDPPQLPWRPDPYLFFHVPGPKVGEIINAADLTVNEWRSLRKAGVKGVDGKEWDAIFKILDEYKQLKPFVKPIRVGSEIRHKWDKGYGCTCPYSTSKKMILMTPLMIDYTSIMEGNYRNSGKYTCPNCKEIRNGARWVCPTPNLIGKYGEICTECCPVTTKDYRELRDIISYMMEIKMGHSKISKV